ncbi:MAG: hypothetical protein ACLQDM_00765 [Bradyrhizobium sp.]
MSLSVRRRASSSLGPLLCCFLLTASEVNVRAEPPIRNVVGLGATKCEGFNSDIGTNPSVRRDYLAWAQGFMSGILLSRPLGTDEGLDLNPPSFNLLTQLKFLQDYCAANTSKDFADGVQALYKRLRLEGKT